MALSEEPMRDLAASVFFVRVRLIPVAAGGQLVPRLRHHV